MQQLAINLLAPHYCCSCGAIGALLCEYCKYDIINDPYEACILCHRLARPGNNLCGSCRAPFTRAWSAGDRREGLRELIDRFKFERVRGAYVPLADLLDSTLPHLPPEVTVVPVPTISPHIRVRGYDQTRLVAQRFARQRNLAYAPWLRRATSTVQRGAGRQQRYRQAKEAFAAPSAQGICLVIDDITTTGATLTAAAQTLLDAGASEVWVAVIACQPLEK